MSVRPRGRRWLGPRPALAPPEAPRARCRAAEHCHASTDGQRWLTEWSAERAFIDGATGRLWPLELASSDELILAAGGARYCVAKPTGLDCVRQPDGRVEHVWQRPTGDSYVVWEPEGQFALISFADGPDGLYDARAFVDFAAMTVQPLRGIKATSGSTFQLHPGGQLISIGSGTGLYVYDVVHARVHFAAHRPLYDNHVVRGVPRRVVAGTDGVLDYFIVDAP